MQHLLYRANTYYFNRRVPKEVKEYDPRALVRFSLQTDSRNQAKKLAALKNAELENYWNALVATGQKHTHNYFKQVVERTKLYGFSYKPCQILAAEPVEELIKRLLFINHPKLEEKQVEAVLGGVPEPLIMLDDVGTKYWSLTNDVKAAKSAYQYRKWQNPRKLALKNLLTSIGNKPIKDLVRDDFIKFRDWWLERIQKENLKNCGCNKNLKQLKTMIRTVAEHYRLELNTDHLFARLKLEDDTESRPPFSTEHILTVLLNQERLKGMSEENQAILMVFAETGVCVDELAGVLPEDIILNADIPHIIIQPRKGNKLKTKFRKRVMPLVGFALDSFKKYPRGFSHYIENPDSISSSIGKYLKENKMLPTAKHSTYSLRHSFQDRLTASKCIDRIQADLMGHKFSRETYGEGATLEDKYNELNKILLGRFRRV